MENRNPYASPRANVADLDPGGEYGEVKILSAQGRLGRVRYLGYGMGLSILIMLVVGILAGVAGAGGVGGASVAQLLIVAAYVAIMVVQVLLTIQRAHDFNSSGWMSLLMFVPLVNLIFLVIPGTPGENRFGHRPPPNTVGVIVLACLLPLVFVGGILAAIAIPAYQDYTIRAQVSEGLNLAAAAKAAVAETFLKDGTVPEDRAAAGMSPAATDSRGKYVASVEIEQGTILVTYGAEANAVLAGKVLGIQPYVTSDKAVAWRCGHGAVTAPEAVAMAIDGVPAGSDIDPRHLPSACRGGVR